MVKEKVAKPIMQKALPIKFSIVRHVRLAAADDHRASFSDDIEVFYHRGIRQPRVAFFVLEGDDWQIAFRFELPHSLCHVGHIAVVGAA